MSRITTSTAHKNAAAAGLLYSVEQVEEGTMPEPTFYATLAQAEAAAAAKSRPDSEGNTWAHEVRAMRYDSDGDLEIEETAGEWQ